MKLKQPTTITNLDKQVVTYQAINIIITVVIALFITSFYINDVNLCTISKMLIPRFIGSRRFSYLIAAQKIDT